MKKYLNKIKYAWIVALMVPGLSSAQGANFGTLVNSWVNLLNKFVVLLGSLAVLFFLWGGAIVILGSGDTAKLKEGKQRMIWSLVGLFVMFSVWGLLKFMDASFFGGGASGGTIPSSSTPPTGLGPQ